MPVLDPCSATTDMCRHLERIVAGGIVTALGVVTVLILAGLWIHEIKEAEKDDLDKNGCITSGGHRPTPCPEVSDE